MTTKDPILNNDEYHQFYVPVPDKDFSEARNNYLIEKTIKETEANHKKKTAERLEGFNERSDAIASYIKHLINKNDSTPIEKYMGERYLARLRGEERIAKIKAAQANGKGFIL